MSAWPREIAAAEVIARGVCSPYHVAKNGKLKPDLYRSPPDKDEVSTMRADWIGADVCKQRAKTLENPVENKVYRGLAVLSAMQIRQQGSDVIDTREVFDGHSDIKHGIVERGGGDPPPAAQLIILRNRWKTLAECANYFLDPEPQSITWTGPPLYYKA
ncbi:MAG TPA: hypothetical protein VMF05_12685 [Stellaceae bacterium]|nr:hypothetical protein [Stellaceae bacterium]